MAHGTANHSPILSPGAGAGPHLGLLQRGAAAAHRAEAVAVDPRAARRRGHTPLLGLAGQASWTRIALGLAVAGTDGALLVCAAVAAAAGGGVLLLTRPS
ncbi:hypothetical protein FHR32_007018 [Streptosporangium album]|uniref:Uncharacterized protein n=1 Tax=Streptosporangium album TaxID=47479 RepID=A0A7W7S2S3_9ACTN|nr:hypothetical protein [Streptosporangium album]MBB4942632.1 hypothetical protein [Streptosporangium album]